MADEIILLERNGEAQQVAFYVPIPAALLTKVGATGIAPIMSDSPGVGSVLDVVLTAPEKSAIAAGAAALVYRTLKIRPDAARAEILVDARALYVKADADVRAEYRRRFLNVGKRFNK